MDTTVTWLARWTLFFLIGMHALMKFTQHDTFITKFEFSHTLGYLVGFAELLGILGIVLGGFVLSWFSDPASRLVGALLSLLGVASVATVQVGAILMVHWGTWMYYLYGMEYNVALLMLCVMVAYGSLTQHPCKGKKP